MQLVTGRGSALQSAASHSADFKGLILPCVGEHAVPAGKDSCLARPIRTSEGRREKSVPGLTLSACARRLGGRAVRCPVIYGMLKTGQNEGKTPDTKDAHQLT